MKQVLYKQCELRKGDAFEVSWIPEQFAKPGHYVRIRRQNKEWDDGWLVVTAGDIRLPHDYVVGHERDYLHQREASDI